MGQVDRHFVVVLALGLAVALSGCFDLGVGGNSTDDPTDGDGGGTNPLAPREVSRTVEYIGIYGIMNLDYTERIEVESESNLTLTFVNNDANTLVVHDWYLPALDVGTPRIGADKETSIKFFVDLPPGEYLYYCSVGNHRDSGMEGTLVVTEYVPPS